ncbi:hypothetical protein SteCoe_4017 [Stentor coeruleus]|uniref:Uncharacterized protein n=1 Tax=Stentor coeruleus TaxID=5963 RepID=A0A1R2CVS0_9CILI|nr:hypothetical protein SteCoe_17939 [Stentor coeruleus]OMJ93075.1 hypothetical protein SteCoe_4017 [Stentor coeruleus]
MDSEYQDFTDPISDSSFISSDIHLSNISSSLLNANNPGRLKNPLTLVLEQFIATSSLKKPKKEFLNAYIIRAIKRAFRSISNGKIPKKTCIAINVRDNIEMNIWEKLQRIFRLNVDSISKKMMPEVGPLTGGKSAREEKKEGPLSFNNAFCKEFFSDEPMRNAFQEIIQLFYCNFSPARCCERFRFYCCSEKADVIHTDECEDKWLRLKDYFSMSYFEDLDVETNQGLQTSSFEEFQSDLNLDTVSIDNLQL